MAASTNRRRRFVTVVGMHFAELGYIPSAREYMRSRTRPKFHGIKEVTRICGSWPKMLSILEKEQPEIWELIHKAPEPKEPIIEEKVKKAKPAKKAEPEGANGKSI